RYPGSVLVHSARNSRCALADKPRSAASICRICASVATGHLRASERRQSRTPLRPALVREQPLRQVRVIEDTLDESVRLSEPRERLNLLQSRIRRSRRTRVPRIAVARLKAAQRIRYPVLAVSDHPRPLSRTHMPLLPHAGRSLSLSDQILTRRHVAVRARRVSLRRPHAETRHGNIRLAREQSRPRLQLLHMRTLITLGELLNVRARGSGILIIRDRINPVHKHLP